jgi:hypothetical protein
MNPTGKAGRPRPKQPKLQGETQFQHFVETVKAVEADETGSAFEKAINVLAPIKPVPKPLCTKP